MVRLKWQHITVLPSKSTFCPNFACTLIMNRNITFSSSNSVQSVKDRSVTEAMTNYDVGLVSRAQYTAIQTIKNYKIEGYRQDEVRF